MPAPEFKTEQLSLVVIGKLNPQIFQPFWFVENELIPAAEAEKATIGVVHPEVSDFTLDWCHLNVGTERLLLESSRPERYPPAFDLLISTFAILSHTPVTALGINLRYVYHFREVDEWHAFGDKLAPKELWKGIAEKPGLANLQMKCSRTDDLKGAINVTVQSGALREAIIAVNDHIQLESAPSEKTDLSALLESQKTESLKRSQAIIQKLIAI